MAEPGIGGSYDNVSSTHADASYSGGTVVGDYQHHEQTQVNTPTEHMQSGSDTSASAHFSNFHDFGMHESHSSYFDMEQQPAAPGGHDAQGGTHGHEHASAFEHTHSQSFDTGTHDGGHTGGSHHDSGPSDHGGGSHDAGSSGAGH